MLSIHAFDAVGDGVTLNTRAIQAAIDACAAGGGGTVLVPAGAFVTGGLELRDRITLHLDAGAVLIGSPDPADFPPLFSRWEGRDMLTHAPLIGGAQLVDVAVTGRGRIEGRGAPWWQWHRENALKLPRPRVVCIADSVNVLIEGITVVDSPSWTLQLLRCDNVTVDKITVRNAPGSPNTDGINPDSSRNVRISNCDIDVADDCIALKSGHEAGGWAALTPCSNVLITQCNLQGGRGGVAIGSEMSGGVRNVVISNCTVHASDSGVRIKTRRGRGGFVQDVRVSHMLMTDVLAPIVVSMYYTWRAQDNPHVIDTAARPVDTGTPTLRGIHFSDITARGAQQAGVFAIGLPERPIVDFSLRDITLEMTAGSAPGSPDAAGVVAPMAGVGIWARHIRGAHFGQIGVSGQHGEPLQLDDVTQAQDPWMSPSA